MKKSDIAMIVLIAAMSVMVAFVVANSIPQLKPTNGAVKTKTVEKIKSAVDQPDEKVFSQDAINPTVETVIGGNAQN